MPPMKITTPKLDERDAQPYVGIRTQVTMDELGSGVIPQLIDEVMSWLQDQELAPAAPPFMRLYVIDMAGKLDMELGWPLAAAIEGEGRVAVGELPAGRYASLIYTGVQNGIAGNKALIDWAEENGIRWDRWDDPNGDAFRSRYESFLTGPDDDPDPGNWDTEVAIKLADD